ncbi:MAG: hypothetical protein H6553_06340 [Chitinophagales bacterium]|nr:hypothetical protein [Chitinophagales bacterium]
MCKPILGQDIYGRPEKLFCSVKCKSYYHYQLRKTTNIEAENIDKILHRNRSILLEILGKRLTQKKVNRLVLENKKFRFKYLTHFHINRHGKMYHCIYDFAWMEFSDDAVLIVKR